MCAKKVFFAYYPVLLAQVAARDKKNRSKTYATEVLNGEASSNVSQVGSICPK